MEEKKRAKRGNQRELTPDSAQLSTHPSVPVDGYSFFCAYQSLALLVVTLDASKQSWELETYRCKP